MPTADVAAAPLRLKRVGAEDCALLYAWANDPDTRRASIYTEPIAWQTHVAWFARKQSDPNCYHFLACDLDNVPVGQIRFDVLGTTAETGITIDRTQRGHGYAALMIAQGVETLFQDDSPDGLQTITAWIKPDNLPSQRAFERARFHCIGLETKHGLPLCHYVLHRPELCRSQP